MFPSAVWLRTVWSHESLKTVKIKWTKCDRVSAPTWSSWHVNFPSGPSHFFSECSRMTNVYIQDLKPCNHATIQDQYCCIGDNMRHAWIQPNLGPCFIQRPGPSRKARRLAWQYSRGDPWHTCQDCGNSFYINISCGKPSSKPSNIADCSWVYESTSFWVVYNAPRLLYFKYVTWFMFGLTALTLALNWIHLSWIVKRSVFLQGIDACVGLPRIVRNHALKSSTAQWLTFWMHVMPSESPHLLLCVQW